MLLPLNEFDVPIGPQNGNEWVAINTTVRRLVRLSPDVATIGPSVYHLLVLHTDDSHYPWSP